MLRSRIAFLYLTPMVLAVSAFSSPARSADSSSAAASNGIETIVVTAEKREQNINDVGMSINAVSGDALIERGAQDPAQLYKVVPGFQYDSNAFGNPIYSMRGVGFQDSTLSASPTVTVYQDEVPIPFSAETLGASLDVERLEALKGPQGTLYGENATGGALNFITAKPTDTLQAGVDASYGRFSTSDISGFLSGPVSDTLDARVSARVLDGGDWQESYTRPDTLGQQNLQEGRILLSWHPSDRLRVSFNLNGWHDRSDSEAPQLIDVVGLGSTPLLEPALVAYPDAPKNDRAADWDPNERYARNNTFYMASLRLDYDISSDVTFTSISAFEKYARYQPIDGDGTALQDIFLTSRGSIETEFEEDRLAGTFNGRGHWIVGANLQVDKTYDNFFEQFADSTSRLIVGLPLNQTDNFTDQNVHTYAGYASADYDLTDTINIQGGARYTQSDRSFSGCSRDTNGQAAAIFDFLQQIFKGGSYVPIPVGGCINLDSAFNPVLATGKLDQHNVSWRGGVNWKASPDTLIYANVSKGYKAGSFPTLSASSTAQFVPAKQESLVAYEAGFKSTLANDTLQINGAAFYYDYQDKQILGRVPSFFGPLLTLINVPKSHITGAELQVDWKPIPGLTISPDVTYIESRIDGTFVNYNSFGDLQDFSGESFPYTPKFQGTLDAQYEWSLNGNYSAFVGGDLSYQSDSNGSLGKFKILDIKPYGLLDLRAGVESGNWRFSIWGRNVTNTYYWNTVLRDNDTVNRYAGMPATYGFTLSYRY